MYDAYIVKRTQIYLTDEQHALLRRRRRASGRTVSELIREAIDAAYVPKRELTLEEKLRILDETAGAWKGRDFTGEEYVERLRSGRRLREVFERAD